MDINSIIRGFLGISDSHTFRTDIFDDEYYNSGPKDEDNEDQEYSNQPDNGQIFYSQVDDVFDHMDMMFKNFSSLFDHSFSDFSDVAMRSLPSEVPAGSNPRDKMLKSSDSKLSRSFWLDNDDTKSEPQIDADLDGNLPQSKSEMLKGYSSPEIRKPQNISLQKSVFIRKMRKSDGSIEEHRTVRDHTGTEVTTVRKTFGDQSYEVTTHTDDQGIKEKREDFINMDQKDLTAFKEKFQFPSKPYLGTPSLGPDKQLSLIEQNPPGDSQYSAIFKKLFGF